jgi:hypothetical protein
MRIRSKLDRSRRLSVGSAYFYVLPSNRITMVTSASHPLVPKSTNSSTQRCTGLVYIDCGAHAQAIIQHDRSSPRQSATAAQAALAFED